VSAPGGRGPLIIGLVGSIAAGKSTVARLLVERGARHCDGDSMVHRLYDPGTDGHARIVAAFGEDVVAADGTIDRKALGAKVFGNPKAMAQLTAAIGTIGEAFRRQVDEWRSTLGREEVAVLEAAAMMEPGFARWCDQVWLIGVDDEVAVERLVATRGMTEEEARQRLASARPFEERAGGADWIYLNSGSRDELVAAVDEEFERVRALHRAGSLPASAFDTWWGPYIAENRKRILAGGVTPADELDGIPPPGP
jgi:dephospho-CoA kinase